MTKELLTDEIIRSDLKKKYNNLISSTVVATVIVVLLLCGFTALHIKVIYLHPVFLKVSLIIINTSVLFVFGYYLISNIKRNMIYRRGEYIVYKDFVVGKKERISSRHFDFYRPYTICFSKYGEYEISEEWHYDWSKEFCMDFDEVWRSCYIGDEVYVVSLDAKSADLIYNTKFFEYKKGGT